MMVYLLLLKALEENKNKYYKILITIKIIKLKLL